ncbi:hypothetical protein J437_LFUL008209 [Ladona fulva]|uniref:Uncharacterized protein n=1 Tax=Ladona fulva TaxID=123851 RepID=A0A8K0K616_LADFU|nr:hypothetical protein J437_LFUL008209 [Ladona fulva]
MGAYGGTGRAIYGVTNERQQDLFRVSRVYSLAYCVSTDLTMSRGIATVFRNKFGHLEQLRAQHPDVSKVLKLRDRERYIFHLVTKETGSQKSRYLDMWQTIRRLRDQLLEDNIS